LAVGNAALATRAATAKEVVDAAVAKEAAKEVAKKKAVEETAMRKLATEETAGKRKAAEEAEVAKKTKSGAVTAGSGPSLAPSTGVKMLRLVALHLRPSGDSTGLGSLGTVCDTSFSISCTASVILI
jgi:hypothetical protein